MAVALVKPAGTAPAEPRVEMSTPASLAAMVVKGVTPASPAEPAVMAGTADTKEDVAPKVAVVANFSS